MNSYKARDILNLDLETLLSLPDEDKIELVFDDKTVITSTNEMIFSQFCWEIQRHYLHAPLLHTQLLTKRVSGMAHAEILEKCLFDTRKHYLENGLAFTREDVEHCSRLISIATNNIFNFVVAELAEYVESGSALDFVDILVHPKVKALNDAIENKDDVTSFDIENISKELEDIIVNDPMLQRNAISKAIRSKVVKVNQALQCIGPRGFVNDIDSQIFPDPIRVGFARGFTRLADGLKESRSATQSLLFTKGPMQDSEYFNRSLQLSAITIEGIYDGDCGSKEYIPVTISSLGLLGDLEGSYYLNEETNKEEFITRNHTHLLGKTVNKRSACTCKSPNPAMVCSRCFGELSISVPRATNIGYVSAAQLQGPVGQLILSNKHYIGSVAVDTFSVSDADSVFIKVASDNNSIYLNKDLKNFSFEIAFDEKEASNLNDILGTKNIDSISPFRISEVRFMEFKVKAKETISTLVQVQSDTRIGSLSRDMLKFIDEKGYTIGENGEYRVKMDGWDFNKPLIELPMKHFDTVDYMHSIESFIKGTAAKNAKTLTSFTTPAAALAALHDLVSLRLSVNIAYLEIIILSTLVIDRKNRDYRLPTDRKNAEMAKHNQLMSLHSLAAAYAYEGQESVIFSTEAFLVKCRPRHILDHMVLG
jgi:hypothetical protein